MKSAWCTLAAMREAKWLPRGLGWVGRRLVGSLLEEDMEVESGCVMCLCLEREWENFCLLLEEEEDGRDGLEYGVSEDEIQLLSRLSDFCGGWLVSS